MMQQNTAPATSELKQLLSTPPESFKGNLTTINTTTIVHANLQLLRDSGDTRFLFLRTVLEITESNNRNEEELLFHCITGVRHVLLTKWNSFSPSFLGAVRDYFMALGSLFDGMEQRLSRPTRLACYNASASFWKRQWRDDDTKSSQNNAQPSSPEEQSLLKSIRARQQQIPPFQTKADLFQYLESLITNHKPGPLMFSGTTFLGILVGEFAGKSASNYNMPLEFHRKAHMKFGSDEWLDKSLQMSMQALSQIVHNVTMLDDDFQEEVAMVVVQLVIDILGWDFVDAWDSSGFLSTSGGTTRTVIRPPDEWREYLMQPEFIRAIFHMHGIVVHKRPKLGHALRQLLLLLASMHGPIFQNIDERKAFASFLLEGILGLLSTAQQHKQEESSELLDTFSMISRVIVNYKLSILVQLPSLMTQLFQGMAMIGQYLLQENWKECQSVNGDLECMEYREWREEALALLLEGIVMVCGDPWLLYSGEEEARKSAKVALAATIGPLYAEFISCRTKMARLEEQYLTANETELDEVREEIIAVDLEEEMASLSHLGRLDLAAALTCLSSLFQQLVPQLQSLWNGNEGTVSPEAAGLLEESRLVTMYIGHLLTDENAGESPQIPEAVIEACRKGTDKASTAHAIVSAVETLKQFAQFQVSKIAINPADPRLSPLLAKSFLWFLNRWAPAYILPVGYSTEQSLTSAIVKSWSSPEAVQASVYFCITLSLHYNCYWPHERQVQETAASLLLSMAKRCEKV